MSDTAKKEFLEARHVLDAFISDESNFKKIDDTAALLVTAFKKGNKVISCGNGGSMSDAMHFAEELSGRFRDDRKALPALAASDPSFITCAANDFGYDHVFARFIQAFGKEGDVLLAISTSGNSTNIINAVKTAKASGMHVIGLTGKTGGDMAPLCDVEIRAPESKYSDRAQEIHIKVIHTLILLVEQAMFSK